MERNCSGCGQRYDDARCLTYCPHNPFMAPDDLERKDLGLNLLGKKVRFAHHDQGPYRRVVSVGWNGMVSLEGMTGEFGPHIFIEECASR